MGLRRSYVHADYDHARDWTRQEVLDLVERGEHAFGAWANARDAMDARAYLVALLAKARSG